MEFIKCITDFFNSFSMRGDVQGNTRQVCVRESIVKFLENENFDTAREVYESFFDSYRVKLEGNANFTDLLDKLLHYEERASTLLAKQRDHYIHSINVFVLGLSIYSQNANYSECFRANIFVKQQYAGRYDCPEEEFLFRWGIASLFHDIGYPVEITHKQIGDFMKFVASVDGQGTAEPYIGYKNFEKLNSIEKIMHESAFLGSQISGKDEASGLDLYVPVDLLIKEISSRLPVDKTAITATLQGYLQKMQKSGFVDHAFYSAVIILKWYGHLVQKNGQTPGVFFNAVLDAASAIFLHNFYPHALTKEPFFLPGLDAKLHPIAFMLILCDELQEWNRLAYGTEDKKKVLPHSSEITLSSDSIEMHYKTSKGVLAEDFASKKSSFLARVLRTESIFPGGIFVSCSTNVCLLLEEIMMGGEFSEDSLSRPTIETLEKMAKKIHEDYNNHQIANNASGLPDWDNLSDDYKYANIRQAKGAFVKVRLLGYVCKDASLPIKLGYEEVLEFPPEAVEPLAELEHENWMQDRMRNGWTYAPVRDNNAKHHPCLVPYERLSEAEKEKDRNAVRNVFPLIRSIGMKVYRQIEVTQNG